LTRSRLSALQQRVLEGFFARTQEFYLTGGAALAGFHLGHRATEDLDLFASTNRLEEGSAALRSVASELGATLESLRTSPEFRRFLLRSGAEALVVDLVFDPVAQIEKEKLSFGRIRVDPPDEILANKLCALLSRSELRDLVDVLELEHAGFDIARALPLAMKKDSGLTPAQLAWVLSTVRIGDDARVPGSRSPVELRAFLDDLQKRLTRLGLPR